MSKAFKIITDAAELDKRSIFLTKRQESVDADYHEYLISEIWHIEKHRNPTRLNAFFTRLTKMNDGKGAGVRVNAMHQFVQTFANVRMLPSGKVEDAATRQYATKQVREKDPSSVHEVFYIMKKERKELSYFIKREEGKAVYSTPISNDDGGLEAYLKLAFTKPWWNFRPEPEARPYNFGKVGETFHNTLKRVFDATATQGFDDAPISLMVDLAKVLKAHGIETGDLTEAFGKVPEAKIPEEISNVIPFPKKAATSDETPATVNATPRPAKAARK